MLDGLLFVGSVKHLGWAVVLSGPSIINPCAGLGNYSDPALGSGEETLLTRANRRLGLGLSHKQSVEAARFRAASLWREVHLQMDPPLQGQ
ncbi:hypothetical protein VTJ04DRAFT_7790 [Mycothermus thermophilus]|uniref:uncharacterized protein n=1 Tax=Humicola insolens TaxID=85995 RepID=UPI0037420BE2